MMHTDKTPDFSLKHSVKSNRANIHSLAKGIKNIPVELKLLFTLMLFMAVRLLMIVVTVVEAL